MNKTLRKVLIVIGVLVVFAGICVLLSHRERTDFHEKYEGADLTVEVEGMERVGAYTGYLNEHADADRPSGDIVVNIDEYESKVLLNVYL